MLLCCLIFFWGIANLFSIWRKLLDWTKIISYAYLSWIRIILQSYCNCKFQQNCCPFDYFFMYLTSTTTISFKPSSCWYNLFTTSQQSMKNDKNWEKLTDATWIYSWCSEIQIVWQAPPHMSRNFLQTLHWSSSKSHDPI